MIISEAKKALKQVGAGRASGDAACAMYASLVVLGCCLGAAHEDAVYRALQNCADDRAIHAQARAWMQDPLSVFDVL